MKRIALALCVGLALVVGVATATASGNSDNAKACQQGWQNFVRQDGTAFKNSGDCVSYAAQGGVLNTKPAPGPAAPVQVSEPTFNLDGNTCSVTVPYTKGLDTVLMGVNGYSQYAPITGPVTVTGGVNGADGTAPQFWIGYTAQSGYVDTNPGMGTWHIDFASCIAA
jgi:hypothetical protein